MTEQLERDLVDMFAAAATTLDVRPPAPRATGLTRLTTAMAAAVTVALVTATALAGVRLAGAPTDKGGVSLSGTDAKAVLVQALRRTLAQPIRIVTRVQLPASTISSFDTEIDYARHEAVERANGQIQMLSVTGHVYQRLSPGMKEMFKVPSRVQWQEISFPPGLESALPTVTSGGWGSLFGVDPSRLDDPAATSRFSVERVGAAGFSVTSAGENREAALFTVGRGGTIVRVQVQISANSSFGQPGRGPQKVTVDELIAPLNAPLRLSPPDPGTVISESGLQQLMRRQQPSGSQSCRSATPSPAPADHGLSSLTVMCSSSVTVFATPAPSPAHS